MFPRSWRRNLLRPTRPPGGLTGGHPHDPGLPAALCLTRERDGVLAWRCEPAGVFRAYRPDSLRRERPRLHCYAIETYLV